MNQQIDIYGAGEAHSLPPHYDPAIVRAIYTRTTVDRDHVGEADVGKFGNNAIVTVVEVLNGDGEIILAETFRGEESQRIKAATARANEIGRKLDQNRQIDLFS